ncbi:hypothetical protein [Rhizobium sp. CCGE 510]|uniref:tetratricopeptide repeat protein n=1 Tax=Rhizobium sp. CCGE 510 TaxID=1132836 RepID=UPI00027B872A|nr:hypothetical protein [Rhizobium sp. CCGE 510]EJT01964.1 hypothetical protein RCCGE510_25716 [Rhizobium sp. CCGE 510]
MDAGQTEFELDDVPEDEARAELRRILADARFKVSERNREFLRYICEARYIDGSTGVKSYIIAVDVFRRPVSFDGTNDPIVRIEANRLRTGIDQYYDAHGESGGLRIEIPKGRYIPLFHRIPDVDEFRAEEACQVAEATGDAVATPAPERRSRLAAYFATGAGVALGAVLVGVALAAFVSGTGPEISVKPEVVFSISADDPTDGQEAQRTFDYLVASVAKFQTLRVVDTSQIGAIGMQAALGRAPPRSYRVALKYYAEGPDRLMWWQVYDLSGGQLMDSGMETTPIGDDDPPAIRQRLAKIVSQKIASSRSAINQQETHEGDDATLGNVCVLRAEALLDEGLPGDLAVSRRCLERTIAAAPGDAEAKATLARVFLAERGTSPSNDLVGQAISLAYQAVTTAPQSDRARTALMTAQFAAGQRDAALDTGYRAMAANPNNVDIAARVGMLAFISGQWTAGSSIAGQAAATAAPPRAAILTLALDAYRKGDYRTARSYAEMINCEDLVVHALRTASVARLDKIEGADRYRSLLLRDPDFREELEKGLRTARYDPAISGMLLDGVAQAASDAAETTLAIQ